MREILHAQVSFQASIQNFQIKAQTHFLGAQMNITQPIDVVSMHNCAPKVVQVIKT
jgi:hypothetical protein